MGSAGTMGLLKVAVPMVLDQGPFTFESDTCNNELPSNILHTPTEFKMGEVDPSKVMLGMVAKSSKGKAVLASRTAALKDDQPDPAPATPSTPK
ncbi:hypothetical protein LPJ61_004306 [Coemansia biformis]|uniref:Uncharacterized protein n=1 Tax=Coemansia biformis TaxID=1286918 RepID=A0A9W7Y9J4_9FUNG|nr:hypothetical protein LPJ61_004306 [Coemansia biformis]